MNLSLIALFSFFLLAPASASELPPFTAPIIDMAGMFPPASLSELTQRLGRFETESGNHVFVITVLSLEGEDITALANRAFLALPLSETERRKTVLLAVARKERLVAFRAGSQLSELLPEPQTRAKLEAQVALYWDGMRPDLGIHGAVYYLFRVLRGDIRVDSQTEEEKLEQISLRGGEAGAIFSLCLGPFLAFFVGVFWGIYATQYGLQRVPRLLMGGIFGGATAKTVGLLMSFLGNYSDDLWYFIMFLAIPLAVFGSLTEFWMSG
ncbi:MAG TPA: TPM domain-containing protein, partial [Candidatus Binatia bacterium]